MTAETYRCASSARWLPRALAAGVLVAATIAAAGLDRHAAIGGSDFIALGLLLLGAILALGVLRSATEVHQIVRLERTQLEFQAGKAQSCLQLEDLASLRFEAPFQRSRRWLPALVLRDRHGFEWRISALTRGGERLLAGILQRTARSDLASWAEVLALDVRMGRARGWTIGGYLVALAFPLAASAMVLLR